MGFNGVLFQSSMAAGSGLGIEAKMAVFMGRFLGNSYGFTMVIYGEIYDV